MFNLNESVSVERGELVIYINANNQAHFGTVVGLEDEGKRIRLAYTYKGETYTVCPKMDRVGKITQTTVNQMRQWEGHISENFE